jgi:hypothetical protein
MKNLSIRITPIIILAILVAIPTLSPADTITLDDGQTLKGTFRRRLPLPRPNLLRLPLRPRPQAA